MQAAVYRSFYSQEIIASCTEVLNDFQKIVVLVSIGPSRMWYYVMEILLFCFVKEELRESREEPTDPQAQQEIINSIEEVYFSSDSFDIVKYELEVSCPYKRKGSNVSKH